MKFVNIPPGFCGKDSALVCIFMALLACAPPPFMNFCIDKLLFVVLIQVLLVSASATSTLMRAGTDHDESICGNFGLKIEFSMFVVFGLK